MSSSGSSAARITVESLDGLSAHEAIPIGFLVTGRVSVEPHLDLDRPLPEPSRWKDYDALEKPSELAAMFDTANWAIVAAYAGEARVGGIVMARSTFGLDLLEGREDLAVFLDVRVHPDCRGKGVGRGLFEAAETWARDHGCFEIKVETQDVNVAACRFYASMGCVVGSIDRHAYDPDFDEVQIIWRKRLELTSQLGR